MILTIFLNDFVSMVQEDACTIVAEKERSEGRSATNEERNAIFQNSCRSSLGAHRTSQMHGLGYMAKPVSVSESLRTQMNEHARATSETQR